MKKCVVVSDSFKGTLSSAEICGIVQESIEKYFPDCQLVKIPVADGGEGTVACFREACGGELVDVTVQGPYGEPINARYLQLPDRQAVIEMASAAGLPLVEGRKDPGKTSTYGVGQLIRHAVQQGNQHILLGLGGSCTNDGGCGCAAALGVVFTKEDGASFVPTGATLDQIAGIDIREATWLLEGVSLTAMCDIDNPMHGPAGAAYVFGPQKGADENMVRFLDRQLAALDCAIKTYLGREVANIPGAGAAGAFGAGMVAFLGAALRPGIEAVLDVVDFDKHLEGCDLVFTGEGRLDMQSIRGKVVSGVGNRAGQKGVPVIAIVGGVTPEVEDICDDPVSGISAVFTTNRQAVAFEEARSLSRENYRHTIDHILRLLCAVKSSGGNPCEPAETVLS